VACVNVANLLLAQMLSRARELAIRTALGASAGRIARQLFTEAAALFFASAAIGVALAPGLTSFLLARYPGDLPLAADVSIDGRVLSVVLFVAFAGAIAASVPRMWRLRRASLQDDLITGGGRGTAAWPQRRLAATLVAAQVGISFTLLHSSALLVDAVVALGHVAPGFDTDRLIVARVSLPSSAAATTTQIAAYQDTLCQKADALPGVERAAHAMFLPFAPGSWQDGYERVGGQDVRPNLPLAHFFMVSPEYFSTVGVRILEGRALTSADRAGTRPVLVASRAFARRAFPQGQVVGRQIRWNDDVWTIVGVAADLRHASLWDPPDADVYVPRRQVTRDNTWLLLRTRKRAADHLPSLARVLPQIDPGAAITDIATLDSMINETVAPERFRALLASSLALVAVALAIVGLYGTVAYDVVRRTREIGVRIALGEPRKRLLRSVLMTAWRTTGVGLCLGGAACLAGDRLLRANVTTVPGGTMRLMVLGSVVFAIVAALAALGPARRASRIDPVEALRGE
jgi:predicted permease